MRNSELGDAAAIRSPLRRFRRRAVAARWFGAGPGLFALSLAGLTVSRLFSDGGLVLPLAAVLILTALGAAAISGPSLVGTARMIDRKAGLEQRLETAMELLHETGPVSTLLLRDARRALERTRGVDVFPFQLGTGRGTKAALAILTLSLLAATFVRRDRVERGIRLSPGSGVPEGASVREIDEPPRESGGESASLGERASAEHSSDSTRSEEATFPVDDDVHPADPSLKETTGTLEMDDGRGAPGSEALEWRPIESPLDRESEGTAPADAGGAAGSPGEQASPDGSRGAGPGRQAGPAPPNARPELEGGSESSPSLDDVPPGWREYVRAYFAKLRNPR